MTIGDLGIVRDVTIDADGQVEVTLTPTYSGCPATEVIRGDVLAALSAAGFDEVRVHTVLAPAWTTDWITEAGRRKLADHGIVPPSPAPRSRRVDVALTLMPPARDDEVRCPRCDSADTALVSQFGATACQAMYRCRRCLEPFDRIKPH
ncbi:MAG: ring,2-phenylacetyl-CoA epoxidase subunit PaaD [Actinomycetota bacterium]|nr:ring,2-phenylacetyl-CoA epoxidase subunit PaaD [Actinomycetota bacterium]